MKLTQNRNYWGDWRQEAAVRHLDSCLSGLLMMQLMFWMSLTLDGHSSQRFDSRMFHSGTSQYFPVHTWVSLACSQSLETLVRFKLKPLNSWMFLFLWKVEVWVLLSLKGRYWVLICGGQVLLPCLPCPPRQYEGSAPQTIQGIVKPVKIIISVMVVSCPPTPLHLKREKMDHTNKAVFTLQVKEFLNLEQIILES